MLVHIWMAAVLGVLYGVPAYLGGCVVRAVLLRIFRVRRESVRCTMPPGIIKNGRSTAATYRTPASARSCSDPHTRSSP